MSKKTAVLILTVLAVLLTAPLSHAARITDANAVGQPVPAEDGQDMVSIDFRDVDIRIVAKFISEITGKNFVFDKQVRDNVTLYSPTQVTPDEAYRLFESVLKIYGYTTVPDSGFIKIVPSQRAKLMDVETRASLPSAERAKDDRVVTQLIRLNYADAGEMRTLLAPLIDKTGVILSYDSGNTLVLTDYASNIDRLVSILRAIDVEDKGAQMAVVPLQHASARDMATELQEILKSTAAKGRPSAEAGISYKVVPDERTNNLIIMARPTEIRTITDLVKQLDLPSPRGSDRVHVHFLKNAVAEDLAQTLNDLTSGQGGGAQAQGQKTALPTRLLLQEDVFITADKATNSLIIRANRQDFLTLKDIIEKLDIQRAQVLVEAAIVEMSFKKALNIGAEWRVLNTEGSELSAFGGTNLSGIINTMASNPFGDVSGLVLGAAEGTLSFGGKTFLNLGLLIQALQTDKDVNILSTPHLLTMDNEEARIVVGEERPFLKSSMTSDTGSTSPTVTRTYDYKDLGLTLKITPHITQGGFVKLKIYQQILNYISEAETGAISSTKRETETTVQVADRETVVIGGLIREDKREGKSQVPCLGNIPVLGWAFKTKETSSDKTNLLILINPSIIRSSEQLQDVTRRKQQELNDSVAPAGGEESTDSKGN